MPADQCLEQRWIFFIFGIHEVQGIQTVATSRLLYKNILMVQLICGEEAGT